MDFSKKLGRRKALKLIVASPFFIGCSPLFKNMFPSAFNLTRDKNLSYDKFVLKIEFPENANLKERSQEIENLEKFPDGIQKMLSDYRVKFVVFDGELKNQKIYLDYQKAVFFNEEERKKAIQETGNSQGAYLPMTRTVMWKLGSFETNNLCSPAQHEISHAIDWAAGNLLEDSYERFSDIDINFKRIYNEYKKNEKKPTKSNEFFANSIGVFYNSNYSREWLKENRSYGINAEDIFLSAYGFAKNLERKIIEKVN